MQPHYYEHEHNIEISWVNYKKGIPHKKSISNSGIVN